MYSSSMRIQDEEKSKMLGANAYIQKPQTYDATKVVIDNLLNNPSFNLCIVPCVMAPKNRTMS
jgi:hypothetical protein